MAPVGHWLEVFLDEPGEPPVAWTDWISEFDKHLKQERYSEKVKVDLLRRFLGEEGLLVLQRLPGPTETYEEIVSALTDHYNTTKSRPKIGHWPEVFLEKPGEPPVPWTDWISEFDKHLKEERCSEKEKADWLRGFLGEEGLLVLQRLPGPTETYEEIVSALTDHYKPSMSKTTAALVVGGTIIGGVGAVVAAPFVLTGIGFTSAGIAAGSYAAAMMSSAAVANGGAVAAGSIVAILQSAGAVGLTAGAATAVGTAGAAGGGLVAGGIAALRSIFKKKPT